RILVTVLEGWRDDVVTITRPAHGTRDGYPAVGIELPGFIEVGPGLLLLGGEEADRARLAVEVEVECRGSAPLLNPHRGEFAHLPAGGEAFSRGGPGGTACADQGASGESGEQKQRAAHGNISGLVALQDDTWGRGNPRGPGRRQGRRGTGSPTA